MANTHISLVSVAHIRSAPSHRSEIVTQLLFGELCDVEEIMGDFVKIACGYDGYEGYAQYSQLAKLETTVYDRSFTVYKPMLTSVLVNGAPVMLSLGAEIYCNANSKKEVNTSGLQAGPHTLVYANDLLAQWPAPMPDSLQARVLMQARQYLGTTYLWGGKSIWGIDCSGLVQMSFKQAGMFVPRDAWQQAEGGDVVGFLQEVQPGDLAFFDNEEGKITHVGIMLNGSEILHASGVVRIDPIDNVGIINKQTGKRTHHLRIIKRFF